MYSSDLAGKAAGFYERAVQLDANFALAWARLSRTNAWLYFGNGLDTTLLGGTQRNVLWKMRRNWSPTRLKPCSRWVIINSGCCVTTGLRKRRLVASRMLPSNSEVRGALGSVTRREGHWDQSIAYLEQALAFDPRNVELLMDSAETYGAVRQFPAALKLYDRVLDITPNDPNVMALKAQNYQDLGNLQEAARLLSEINEQTY